MQDHSESKVHEVHLARKLQILAASLVFIIALTIRVYHLDQMPIDRIHDSYYRWLISVLTSKNGWVYTDFKPQPNMTVGWLPLYQYLEGILMALTGNWSLTVPRLISIVSGTAACVAVYALSARLFGSVWLGTVGGLALAFQSWHIDFSTLAMPDALVSLLGALMLLFFFMKKMTPFYVTLIAALLTGYEAWVLTGLLISAAYFTRRWSLRQTAGATMILLLVAAAWFLWSFAQTGNPLAWIEMILYTMFPLGWAVHLAPLSEFLFYFNFILVMSFFVFYIAVIFGLVRSKETRFITILAIGYLLFFSLLRQIGLEYGKEERPITILPAVAALVPAFLPKLNSKAWKRGIAVMLLLLILLIPYFAQIWVFPKKVYVVNVEYRAGIALKGAYQGGMILADFPVVIYYSQIPPNSFLSYDAVDWYLENPDPTHLENWINEHQVRYLVWQNVTYSVAIKIFPELADGGNHRIGNITLTNIYEDSARSGNWEHAYGVPDIFVYSIQLS